MVERRNGVTEFRIEVEETGLKRPLMTMMNMTMTILLFSQVRKTLRSTWILMKIEYGNTRIWKLRTLPEHPSHHRPRYRRIFAVSAEDLCVIAYILPSVAIVV